MSKQIQNLIKKHGVTELHSIIDAEATALAELREYKHIMDDDDLAIAWFKDWATSKGLEIENPNYKGQQYKVKGWTTTGPYILLWTAENNNTQFSRAHFEVGNTLYDLWSTPLSMKKLANMFNKIIELNKETA